MLSSKTLKFVDIAFTHVTTLRIIPFKWNSKTFKLTPVILPKWKLICYHLIISICIWSYTIYLIISKYIVDHQQDELKKQDRVRYVLLTFYILAYITISTFLINTIRRRVEIAEFVNQYFKYVRKLQEDESNVAAEVISESEPKEKQGKPKQAITKKEFDSCATILKTLLILTYFQSMFAAMIYFEDPTAPRYIYSLIGTHYHSKILICIFGVFEYGCVVCLWHIFIFNLIVCFCYFYGTIYWLQKIIVVAQNSTSENPDPESIQDTYHKYKTFQVLINMFNDCFSKLYVPALQFFLILLPVATNNIVIRYYGHMSISLLIAFILISICLIPVVLIYFPKAAIIYSTSCRYLNLLSTSHYINNPEQALLKKQLRACFKLKIHLNSFNFIQKFTTLKIIASIVYWTLRSLLLTRDK